MSLLLQNLFVLLLVAGCAGYVGWQAVRSLRGRRSRLGSCCAKGCAAPTATAAPSLAGSSANSSPKPTGVKVAFIPVEMLARRK